jgi:hypothetical protein
MKASPVSNSRVSHGILSVRRGGKVLRGPFVAAPALKRRQPWTLDGVPARAPGKNATSGLRGGHLGKKA